MNELHAFGAAARAELEKDAAPNLGAMARSLGNYATNRVLPAAKNLASKAVEKATPVVNKATTAAKPYVDDLASRATGAAQAVAGNPTVQGAASRVGNAANRVAKGVGTIGQLAQDATRGGLNMADDAARYAMNGPGSAAAAGGKFGDKVVRGVQTEAGRAFGTSPVGDKLNPLNLAAGGGAIYGAGKATGLLGSGSADAADPTSNNLQEQQHRSYDMQKQMQTNTGGNNSQGLMGMWNSLPIEARYAIGAGVPLALAGAVMGGRGNTGAGLGMGALGLGAAGLGAAGAGMFGDGARRMVGQGANALYGMVGGQSDPMSQMRTLGKLSPEFGTTALMGRDPNLGSQQARGMYDFMTQNQEAIERLMPQLQNSSVTSTPAIKAGAYFAEKLAGRCWTGYEPVPGKKPYSNDSCRPVSKKKKKSEKKAASPFGPAQPITGARPTMTQMPPKPAEKPVAKRDVSKLPPYVSQGQQAAEQAAKQPPMNTMVKTQAAKKAAAPSLSSTSVGNTVGGPPPGTYTGKVRVPVIDGRTGRDSLGNRNVLGVTSDQALAANRAAGNTAPASSPGSAPTHILATPARPPQAGQRTWSQFLTGQAPGQPLNAYQTRASARVNVLNAPQSPMNTMVKTQAAKKFAGVAGQGKTTMNATPSSRGDKKLVDDKQRETNSPVPTDAKNTTQGAGMTAAEKQAFGAALGRAIGTGARGLVSGAGQVMSGLGRGATAVGGTMAQQSARMVNAVPNRPTINAIGNIMGTAGTAAGAAASAVGQTGQLAGRGVQALGRNTATALPVVGAAAYYGSGKPTLQSPVLRSPITWENNNNGVKPMQSGRINQPL